VSYLLDAANSFFPAAYLTPADVVSAWAGIRPLVPSVGDTPGAASREHAITTSPHALVSITGGKLTTYRVMAADVIKVVLGMLHGSFGPDRTRSVPLPGGEFASLDALVADAARVTNDPAAARHLVMSYGTRWTIVWSEITQPGGGAALVDGLPYTVGELRYCVRNERAYTLADLLIRRTRIAYETRDHGLDAAETTAIALSTLFGWGDAARGDAIRAYAAEADGMFAVDE
jgi:glycerol-3-phosphate dehydrogenase